MSRLLVRLLLAVILLHTIPLIYIFAFYLLDRAFSWGYTSAFYGADAVAGLLLVTGWVLVWRRQVVWTPRRYFMTLIAIAWSIVPAFILGGIVVYLSPGYFDELAIVVGGLCWASAWLASTVLIWRETATERLRRAGSVADAVIACPACGYNLTGLHQTRCPECGAQYTLDELFSILRERASDLESEQIEPRKPPLAEAVLSQGPRRA
ncbi:MAG: hypothetical protein ABII12_07090 [Planctomycetota bacterium]